MRAARPGSTRASSCCSPTRTARAGTRRRSPAGARRSTARSRCAARGPYVVQAAIASLHLDEPHDWPQIAALYGELARLTGSPIVELNRAIAVAEAQGPRRGSPSSTGSASTATSTSTRRAPTCCAGSAGPARRAAEYERALELAHTEHERRFLRRRIAEVGA